jgi:hypothetical protein
MAEVEVEAVEVLQTPGAAAAEAAEEEASLGELGVETEGLRVESWVQPPSSVAERGSR